MGKIFHRQMLKLLCTSTLSPTKGPGFRAGFQARNRAECQAECRAGFRAKCQGVTCKRKTRAEAQLLKSRLKSHTNKNCFAIFKNL